MIRVLQIVDNIAQDRGVAAVVMNLYRNIDHNKVQFDFLVCSKTLNSYEDEIIKSGGHVYYTGNPLSVSEFFVAQKNIKAFFKKHQGEYNIVHLHSPTIALFTLFYALKYGVSNRIVHSHSSMTSTNRIKSVINLFLMSAARRLGNHYWACSTEAAKFLFGKKICEKCKITLIMNAVDPRKFRYNNSVREQYRDLYGLNNNKVIIHVSNFSRVKNVKFLLPIIKRITGKYDDFFFIFLGDGPEKKHIEDQLKNNNKVLFAGRVNNVSDYLQMADLLLLPSLKEGLPVSVVEAQACGLRCLVTETITKEADVGGVKYLPLIEDTWEQSIINYCNHAKDDRQGLAQAYLNSCFNLEKEGCRVQNLYLQMETRYE